MLTTATIKFLKDLKKNNEKAWFEKNRARYESARADFADFIQLVVDLHGKKDASIRNIVAKDCMFRINRDVRFSKNKAPYKSNFGASINKSGKKGITASGYYFHFEPGATFVGGGIWMPEPPLLARVRQEIDYNYEEFKKIIAERKFRTIYGDLEDAKEYKLSRPPKGYEADNPAAEYLKLKSYIASQDLTDAELNSKDLVKKTVAAFDALQPLLLFINRGLEA